MHIPSTLIYVIHVTTKQNGNGVMLTSTLLGLSAITSIFNYKTKTEKKIKSNQKALQGGWQSSPPACMASLIFESWKARDLESVQGHISMHNTCRTTSTPNHLTVASRTAKIWPLKFREISTFRDVWTLVVAFLEGNSKMGLWKVVDQFAYYHYRTSVSSSMWKWRSTSTPNDTLMHPAIWPQ